MKVGILGATGTVGRRYRQLLKDHPWFEVAFLAASERSADGKEIHPVDAIEKCECDLVFSCIGNKRRAREVEEAYARAGKLVVSNTSAHRMRADVPLIIPEINPHHLTALDLQPWSGGIICKPNCSIQSYLLPLSLIHRYFPLKKIIVTTLQSVSGAGHASVAASGLEGNIFPFIKGEEKKSEREPLKILGELTPDGFRDNTNIHLSATCTRVPVLEGHMASVSFSCEGAPSKKEILALWKEASPLDLPSAPETPLVYIDDPMRPQPVLDKDAGHGMTVTVGRLRECPALDYRFVGLSHNTVRGAAGGGILLAELVAKQKIQSLKVR